MDRNRIKIAKEILRDAKCVAEAFKSNSIAFDDYLEALRITLDRAKAEYHYPTKAAGK